jgi:hypothetical protein
MTFSIRSFLLLIALLAFWLGAFVSKSPLMMELATSGTVLLILLTLAFAIWDRRPEQRAFWTGCFVLGFGNLVLASYWGGYQRTSYQVAQLIVGSQPAQSVAVGYTSPAVGSGFMMPPPTAPMVTYYQPTNSGAIAQSYAIQMPVSQEYYQQQEAIRGAVPTLLSLMFAGLGGWMTVWIWRRSKDDKDGGAVQ